MISISIDFNGIRFRPKIFDTGFEPLPLNSDEVPVGDGFERREADTDIEVKEENKKPKVVLFPSSIDGLLVPEGVSGLSDLVSTISNKKLIENNILVYLFFQDTSKLNVTNDNDPRYLVHNTPFDFSSSKPYPRSYTIIFTPTNYFVEKYETLEEIREGVHYSGAESVDYLRIPRLYDVRLFWAREEVMHYTEPIIEISYDVSEFHIPKIKPIDKVEQTPRIFYRADTEPYPRRSDIYRLEIESIRIPKASIETLVQSEIKVDYAQKAVTTNYVPETTLLEVAVEESSNSVTNNVIYFDFRADTSVASFNLPVHQHNNKRKNPESDISKVVIKAFDNSKQEQRQIYQETDLEEDFFRMETANANDNVIYTEQRDAKIDYRDPQRRNNFEWNYKKVKTKYQSTLRNLEKRLKEITNKTKNYFSKNSLNSVQDEANLDLSLPEPIKGVDDFESEPVINKIKNKYKSERIPEKTYEVPTPKKQPELKKIPFNQEKIEAFDYSSYQHKISTGAKDFSMVAYNIKTGEYYSHNGNMSMPLPSLNKIALAATVAYYAQHGKLDLDQYVTIQKDLILDNDRVYKAKEGQKVKLGDMVDAMLTRSVDTYFNHILFALGYGDVDLGIERSNKFMDDLGFSAIKINDVHTGTSNYNSSVADGDTLVRLMYFIDRGDVLKPKFAERINNAMENEQWSPFFKGRRKITATYDGMGLVGITDDGYIVFHAINDFHGEQISKKKFDDHGERRGNDSAGRGMNLITNFADYIRSSYSICKDSVQQKKAA